MKDEIYDLLVVGGGINGAGIARDAAGRGMRVLLAEKDDLASHTSSASTKLIHGGLRYLEQREFRLVRESLREREVLLANAPHIVWPLRFVLPHEPAMRPRWLLRAGLWLYDALGGRGRSLPRSHGVDLRAAPHRAILQDRLTHGFAYSDCWVEDARLVVLTAMDAAARGATVLTRTRCTALIREGDLWAARLEGAGAASRTVVARALVNAAGPFVDAVAQMAFGQGTPARLRLVKGSHIVVRRAYPGAHAYLFQQPDGRIVFAIPYERDFTLIGTTEATFAGDLDHVTISPAEADYLRAAASRYFRSAVAADEIVSSYAGVRPLYEDAAADNSTVTRDYAFELDRDGAPALSVYGGKLTTYRRLAEHALARLGEAMAVPGTAWTAAAPLPGGDMAGGFARFLWDAAARWPWLPPELLQRLARAYGTRTAVLIGAAESLGDMGTDFGGGVYEAELAYTRHHEFARTGEDFLWRRSKLGLHLPEGSAAGIAAWFAARAA